MISRENIKIFTVRTDKDGETEAHSDDTLMLTDDLENLGLTPHSTIPVIIGPPVSDGFHVATDEERKALPEGSKMLTMANHGVLWGECILDIGAEAVAGDLIICPDAPAPCWWFRTDLAPEAYVKGQMQWFLVWAKSTPAGGGEWEKITEDEARYLQAMPHDVDALGVWNGNGEYWSWVRGLREKRVSPNRKKLSGRRWIRRDPVPTIRVEGHRILFSGTWVNLPDGEYRLVEEKGGE